jgi:hypothetical protein
MHAWANVVESYIPANGVLAASKRHVDNSFLSASSEKIAHRHI